MTGIAGRLERQERTVSWPRRLEPRARGAGRAAPPVKAQGGGRGDVITYGHPTCRKRKRESCVRKTYRQEVASSTGSRVLRLPRRPVTHRPHSKVSKKQQVTQVTWFPSTENSIPKNMWLRGTASVVIIWKSNAIVSPPGTTPSMTFSLL